MLVVALVVCAAAVALAVVAEVTVATVHAARARSAADAAALAGVDGGEPAARRLATANGADLVRFARDGADVVVTIRVGRVHGHARATSGP